MISLTLMVDSFNYGDAFIITAIYAVVEKCTQASDGYDLCLAKNAVTWR